MKDGSIKKKNPLAVYRGEGQLVYIPAFYNVETVFYQK